MSMPKTTMFFKRRLAAILRGWFVKNYREDHHRGEIRFTIVGQIPLNEETMKRIRQLLGTATVNLTLSANSTEVVAQEAVFPPTPTTRKRFFVIPRA